MKKFSSIANKTVKLTLVFLMMSIVVFSAYAQIAIQNNSHDLADVNDEEIIILHVGSDQNVNLAVDTFLEYYPNEKCIKTIPIETRDDLNNVLTTTIDKASLIIFGHGTQSGLQIGEIVLAWESLKFQINSLRNKLVPVMACYSGQIEGNYGGIPYQLDAEAAGIYGAYLIDIQRNKEPLLNPEMLSIAKLKQSLLAHPLSSIYTLYFSEPASAELKIISDQAKLTQPTNLQEDFSPYRVINEVDSNDYYYSEGKNPYHVGHYIPSNPIEVEIGGKKSLVGSDFHIVYAISDIPWAEEGEVYLDNSDIVYTENYMSTGFYNVIDLIFWTTILGPVKTGCVVGTFLLCMIPPQARNIVTGRSYTFGELFEENINHYFNVYNSFATFDLTGIGKYLIALECMKLIWELMIVSYYFSGKFIETVGTSLLNSGVFTGIVEVLIEHGATRLANLLVNFVQGAFSLLEPVFGFILACVNILPLAEIFAYTTNLGEDGFGNFLKEIGSDEAEQTIDSKLNEIYSDSDQDSIPNYFENQIGVTDANDNDYDNDGFTDDWELTYGFDAADPNNPGDIFWKDSELIGGSNNIEVKRLGLNEIDKVIIFRRPHNSGSYNHYRTIDTCYLNEISETVSVYDTNGDLEWTDIKVEYYILVNPVDEEYMLVDTKFIFAYDDDGTPLDSDDDWLPDIYEDIIGTEVNNQDSDSDFIMDGKEILYWGTNPKSEDSDKDGLLDIYDTIEYGTLYPNEDYRHLWDIDGDSLPNWIDYDSDNDGLSDSEEDTNTGGISRGYYDPDRDLSDLHDADTDDDGIIDGLELEFGIDPKDDDYDNDGFKDGFEIKNGLNPKVIDSQDWALFFADDFAFNDFSNNWEDISTQGSVRTGGLATTTEGPNEADEDFITNIINYDTDNEFGDNLIAYYPFETNEGTTAYDQSGNDNDGTISGATWTSTYKEGSYALNFERGDSTDSVSMGDDNDFSFVGDVPFSISAWIQLKSEDIWQGIASKYETGSKREYFFVITDSNRLEFALFGDGDSSDVLYTVSSDTITIDTWYYVVATYDGSESETGLELYINGESDVYDRVEVGSYSGMINTASVFRVGSYNGNTSPFDGKIDDVRIYDDELSIKAIYELYYGSYRIDSGLPKLAQESTDTVDTGFVVSWDLSDLRGSSSAQAIESASITLDYWGDSNWGTSDDDVKISLVNTYAQGGYLNDSSPDTHASSVLSYKQLTIENIDCDTSHLTLDIIDLVDYWYQYSNDSMLSLFIEPDDDNSVGTKHITFEDETDGPEITIVTGDSVLRADDYGTGEGDHGPEIVHNFDSDIDDFNLTGIPYLQSSTSGRGRLLIRFYSGDDATGTELGHVYWRDAWTGINGGQLFFNWNSEYLYTSSTSAFNNWFDADTDSFSVQRNGTEIEFNVDGGSVEYTHATKGGSTTIRSMNIVLVQTSSYSVVPKLGLRSIMFQGHSDDYDDDTLSTSEEQTYGTNIWSSDSDGDLYTDYVEVDEGTDPADNEDVPIAVHGYATTTYCYLYLLGSDLIGKVKVKYNIQYLIFWWTGWSDGIVDSTCTTEYGGDDCFYVTDTYDFVIPTDMMFYVYVYDINDDPAYAGYIYSDGSFVIDTEYDTDW